MFGFYTWSKILLKRGRDTSYKETRVKVKKGVFQIKIGAIIKGGRGTYNNVERALI